MIAIKIINTINAREITAVFLLMNFLTNSLNLLCALGSSSAAARLMFDVVFLSAIFSPPLLITYSWVDHAIKNIYDQVDQDVLRRAREVAEATGATIEVSSDAACLKGADVLYTDIWASMGEEAQIPEDKKIRDISKKERRHMIELMKNFEMHITGVRGFNEAIVTRGGVNVKEINPSTMESKKVKHLFFAGEMMDLDAVTGGYNLQIAWTTGYVAGKNA